MLPLYLHIGRTEDKKGREHYLRLTLSNSNSSGLVEVCSLCNFEKDCTGKNGGQYSHSSPTASSGNSLCTGSMEVVARCKVGNTDTLVPLHHLFLSVVLRVGGLLQKKRAGSTATRFSLPYLLPSPQSNFPLYSLILGWAEEK